MTGLLGSDMAKPMAAPANLELAREVGQRIDQAWKRAGYESRADMVRDTTLKGYNQVSQWAAGKALPRVDFLSEIARVCRVSLDWLATGEGQDPAVLTRWLDGPGASAPREARAFLASLPLQGDVVDERFYSLAFEAWKRGETPEGVVNAARTTRRHDH